MSVLQCPFCDVTATRLFHVGPLTFGIWDRYPVNEGHALLLPKRHVATWFELTPEERNELTEAVDVARRAIEQRHTPQGYNIGVNIGAAAGQTVPHMHLHVIPRYTNDVPDPTGGVRNVIPTKGNYLAPSVQAATGPSTDPLDSPNGGFVVRGQKDHLLTRLLDHIDRARAVDIAVAFVFTRGLACIEAHISEMLARGGKLRLLTGDYCDLTEPEALRRLLDLSGDVELRVYETAGGRTFHPKAYIFSAMEGPGAAFVGSSNLSETALTHGVEWNYRVADGPGLLTVDNAFEDLFRSGTPLTAAWIDAYELRRKGGEREIDHVAEPLAPPPPPHEIQREALDGLRRTREAGNKAGLVVLATGLGKTWLAAFDAAAACAERILFVAHRDEILEQAVQVFRRLRPKARLGRYDGVKQDRTADVLFASVQTLGKARHLGRFARDAFDYIVVDEFHHASASTYRRLIAHFEPRFLLGLTATPERTDGGDLLALCEWNLVYRCDLLRGIEAGRLAPFHYYGVPDDVDYKQIPMRGQWFDIEELTVRVATTARANNALEQWRKRSAEGDRKETRTLAFCASIVHADFMAKFFQDAGVRAVAVHGGPSSAPRAGSMDALKRGDIEVIFAVDLFNEGVDIPDIDTVLMLRPTESKIVFLQQLGRGLRRAPGKDHLTVVDYIGNHRSFLAKPSMLLALPPGDGELRAALAGLRAGTYSLPPGCMVTYDLQAVSILEGLMPPASRASAQEGLRRFIADWTDAHGARPTASEAYQEGWNPHTVKPLYDGWHAFLDGLGALNADEQTALTTYGALLKDIASTKMEKTYKMVLLQAMLDADALPGAIGIDALVAGVTRRASRSARLQEDFSVPLTDAAAIRRLLLKYPIPKLETGKQFVFSEGEFRSVATVRPEHRDTVARMVRELVEWRLADHLGAKPASATRMIYRVSHSAANKPILFLNRDKNAETAEGWTSIVIDGQTLEGNFGKIALNVVRRPGEQENLLPSLLRGWFGTEAGVSGSQHKVACERGAEGWELRPVKR
jgi:superfamily II DNA or RNA helicase/HKD family nuclease/diadenosine tetraphosphate (Ap4A) HIT family hydrolase